MVKLGSAGGPILGGNGAEIDKEKLEESGGLLVCANVTRGEARNSEIDRVRRMAWARKARFGSNTELRKSGRIGID
jgi:hypothetical protein